MSTAQDIIARAYRDARDMEMGAKVFAQNLERALTAAGWRLVPPAPPQLGPGIYRNAETGLRRKFLYSGPRHGKWVFERAIRALTPPTS